MPIFVFALAMPLVRTNRPILAFCSAKTCSTRERIFDFALLARRVAAGIGIGGGLLAGSIASVRRVAQPLASGLYAVPFVIL